MPVKLSTTVDNIDKKITNPANREMIFRFYEYLESIDTSENYQNGILKAILNFCEFVGIDKYLLEIKQKEQIVMFLDSKRKSVVLDSEQKWITTWKDYLWRIKYFFRWLYNFIQENKNDIDEWITPDFIHIRKKKTKRISPYSEGDIWDRDELLSIVRYETHKRNKAILTLLWDLNARPHEIALLKIKNIRLKEKYAEGEIPHQAKTGTGPILLTVSFPYVRDWLNEHPFRNEPNARLICNIITGTRIRHDSICDIMKQLRNRLVRLLEKGEITDIEEIKKLEYLIKAKKWNPYRIRYSAITADSDYLPEFALRKKVRWSMNSKQGTRYIKTRMGDDLKNKILIQNGIISEYDTNKRLTVITCPRCELVNTIDNKYCSKCSYPLVPSAYDEIKESEEKRIKNMKEQIQMLITLQKEIIELLKYPEKLMQIVHMEK